jgi:hypothetical protein
MMATATATRVSEHTAKSVNDQIQFDTDRNIAYYSQLDAAAIDRRLEELDREWDIERLLETNAASVTIASFVLGAVSSRKWFALSGIVGCFLLQHAVQGWCPPLPVFRRLGFRTSEEIEQERQALLKSRHKASL